MVVQPDKENCKDYEEDDAEEEEQESVDTRQRADAPAGTFNATTSLDSQDSVHRRFNPASIQVRLHVF